jgi:hypothetical protein
MVNKEIDKTAPVYPDPSVDPNAPPDQDHPLDTARAKKAGKKASINDPIKCPSKEDYKAAEAGSSDANTEVTETKDGYNITVNPSQPAATNSKDPNAPPIVDTSAHINDPACMQLKAQEKAKVLYDNQKIEAKDLSKDMDSFDSAEEKLGEKNAECNNKYLNTNAQIAAKQADLKATSAEEMTALQGLTPALDQTMSNLQAQVDAATAKEAEINGLDMTQAYNDYQRAISAALTSCEHNLVNQGKGNQLTYSSLNQAIQAAQVGITTFKCNQDFDTQQARYLALQALNQKKQALQVQFLQMQNEIARLNRQAVIERSKLGIEKQKMLTGFTMKIAQDQQQIESLSQSLAGLSASCGQARALGQKQAARAETDAQDEVPDLRADKCQLQYFKDTLHVEPNKGSTPNTDDFSEVDKALKDNPIGDTSACPENVKGKPKNPGDAK